MEIRSYRRVFDLERRVYSIDRLRLNPGGVPVRGIVYFVAVLALGALSAHLPLLDRLASALPWYVRDLALPGVSAMALSAIRIEGRTFHVAAQAVVRHRCGPRQLAVGRATTVGGFWSPSEIVLLPDGSDARMRHLLYTGPGAVLVAVEHELGGRASRAGRGSVITRAARPRLTLRQPDGAVVLKRGQVIALAAGARLLVRSHGNRSAVAG